MAGDPTPCTGKVIRVDLWGHKTDIASGLFLPTGDDPGSQTARSMYQTLASVRLR